MRSENDAKQRLKTTKGDKANLASDLHFRAFHAYVGDIRVSPYKAGASRYYC